MRTDRQTDTQTDSLHQLLAFALNEMRAATLHAQTKKYWKIEKLLSKRKGQMSSKCNHFYFHLNYDMM